MDQPDSGPAARYREHDRAGSHALADAIDMFFAGDVLIHTWDPGRETTLSDGWRRVGTDRLISTTLCVIDQFRAAHPDAARVLIGDISLPKGGPFGKEYGGLGHVSHQIGLDVDIYYRRLDHVETAPLAST